MTLVAVLEIVVVEVNGCNPQRQSSEVALWVVRRAHAARQLKLGLTGASASPVLSVPSELEPGFLRSCGLLGSLSPTLRRFSIMASRFFTPLNSEVFTTYSGRASRFSWMFFWAAAIRSSVIGWLETQIQVDEAALGVQIPVLCIQPLVENAIKHGIAPKAGRGILSVSAKAVDGEVLIAVQDSSAGTIGVNPPFERSGAGVGLANVRRRLQLCFGAQADVVIDSGPTRTCVQVAIPLNPPSRASSSEVAACNEVH